MSSTITSSTIEDDDPDGREASTTTLSTTTSSTIEDNDADGRVESQHAAKTNVLVAAAERLANNASINISVCTTVMFRNLPKNLTQISFLEALDGQGFSTFYDFSYLPIDFQKMVSFGYAVVNFTTHEAAENAMLAFSGFTNWPVTSRKACTMVWNMPCQGLAAHVQRYRDSPLMHHDVPQGFKPMLFSNGLPVAFPLPSKQLKTPPRWSTKRVKSTVCSPQPVAPPGRTNQMFDALYARMTVKV